MKAALLFGKTDIRIQDIPLPAFNDNEILLKIKSATICGTDLRMYNNGYKSINEENPLILGHELSGVIDKRGKNVNPFFRPGMRVAVAPNMGCGQCEMCISGNSHLCNEYKAFGINIPGGFAEYVVIPEAAIRQGNVMPLPDHISFAEAALIEPLSCVYNAFERAGIKLGDDVLILGAGPIGLMHAMMARKGGAAKVIVSDLSEERLQHAQSLDAGYTVITLDNLAEKIAQITSQRGVDVCITANPSPKAQIAALEVTAINGRVIYFGGIPENSDLSGINTNKIHYRQLIVSGTTRQSIAQFRKILKLIGDGILPVQQFITHTYSLEDIMQALQNIQNGKGIKHAIDMQNS